MNNSKKQKQKDYYLEGINMLLKHDETLENYKQILSEYQEALDLREDMIAKLNQEIKIIKALRI